MTRVGVIECLEDLRVRGGIGLARWRFGGGGGSESTFDVGEEGDRECSLSEFLRRRTVRGVGELG